MGHSSKHIIHITKNTNGHAYVEKSQKTQISGCRTPLDNRKFVSDTNKHGISVWGQISFHSRGTQKTKYLYKSPLKNLSSETFSFFFFLVYTVYAYFVLCLPLVGLEVVRKTSNKMVLYHFWGVVLLGKARFLSTSGRVFRLL